MAAQLWILLALVGGAALSFHLATRCNRRGRLLRRIPGPMAYPLVGNLLRFNVRCLHEFWKIGRQISDRYYPITRFWLCSTAVISVRHPDDIQILLSSPKLLDKGYIYEYLHPWLRSGLLTSTGSKWRQRRRILTPAFHQAALQQYLDAIDREARTLADQLDGREDLLAFCSRSTLKIICDAAMGVSLDSLDGRTVESYERAVHDMGRVVLHRMPRPYLSDRLLELDCSSVGRMQRNALRVLHRFSAQVIEDRRDFHRRRREIGKATAIGPRRRAAMLDLLLAAEASGLVDSEGIQEEVDTFAFEAHDTTAMAMAYTLMLLAEHPQAQERARRQAVAFFDSQGGRGTGSLSDLRELDYLERCVKEALRLFPPVATLMRYTPHELQLKNALIPADSHVMLHLYDAHRDPNFWPRPHEFQPDRFLPENSRDRHPFAYVPFSAGPRNCIGQKFAMIELKLLIGRIVRNYRLEPVDRLADMRLTADIVLRPLDSLSLRFVRISDEDEELFTDTDL